MNNNLTRILDEIEKRAMNIRSVEYGSPEKYRYAVGLSADDVPALVKALRYARKRYQAVNGGDEIPYFDAAIAAILNQGQAATKEAK